MTTLSMNPSSASAFEARRFLPWLILLFVGSGCAALVYEIIWLQKLSLVIGSSGISLGVLLGTFMGGMCLGSLLLPRLIPRSAHPLIVYAVLEILIAVCGIAIIYGIQPMADWYASWTYHTPWMRASIAALCLLAPTMLMGATLPAIARWVETTPEGVSWMGFFYGGNIVGAVAGCLLAGFKLLPDYNMTFATFVAAAINLVVAVVAILLASKAPHVIPTSDSTELPEAGIEGSSGNGLAYLVIALSGFVALGSEVIWTRLLSLMLGQTVYTFSIILAVFLVGLGIGSSVGAAAARSARNPRSGLGWCQLLAAAAVGWAAYMISKSLPFWPVDPQINSGRLSEQMENMRPMLQFQLDIVRTAWVVLPGAILWGASFPLALASVATRGKEPGKLVGGVYAANTLGAIGGALAFSLFLVPEIGTANSQKILIVVSALSGVIALLPYIWPTGAAESISDEPIAAPSRFSVPSLVAVILSLGVVGVCVASVAPVPWVAVAFGRMSTSWLPDCDLEVKNDDKAMPSGRYNRVATYVGEGMNVSVTVTRSSQGWQYFHGAGKVQASSDPQDMRLQRLLGHISVLAHARPDDVKSVLVVACGAGVTAGSFVPYPFVKDITICDIEPLVPTKVTPKFNDVNYFITDKITVENPKKEMDGKTVEVAFDDGRHFVRTLPAGKKYDVITSDPIDPWVKGCAALNTIEYYQMCKDHLNPGGVMSLWIPLYESDQATAESVLATFFKVFPNGVIWTNDSPGGEGYDAVLFGRNDGDGVLDSPVNIDEMITRLDSEAYAKVKKSLLDVGFGTKRSPAGDGGGGADIAIDLLSTYAGGGQNLKEWGKNAQINNDNNLRLQYLAGRAFNQYKATEILNSMLKYYKYPDKIIVGSAERVEQVKQALQDVGRTRYAHSSPAPKPSEPVAASQAGQ